MERRVSPYHEENSTRQEIINIFRTVGPMSVGQLAERLKITHVAVRRHLIGLERDGLITSVQERLPMGRPARIYSLTESAEELFPKNYGTLTLEVFEFLRMIGGTDSLEQFFALRGRKMAERYGVEVKKGATLAERVERLTAIQRSAGYLAQWEQTADGSLLLKEFNCPIHLISREYQHACEHELDFFKEVLETPHVERLNCLVQGGACCMYRVAAPQEQ